jgi:hypothetical protein
MLLTVLLHVSCLNGNFNSVTNHPEIPDLYASTEVKIENDAEVGDNAHPVYIMEETPLPVYVLEETPLPVIRVAVEDHILGVMKHLETYFFGHFTFFFFFPRHLSNVFLSKGMLVIDECLFPLLSTITTPSRTF